jgi:hypothetical protein
MRQALAQGKGGLFLAIGTGIQQQCNEQVSAGFQVETVFRQKDKRFVPIGND